MNDNDWYWLLALLNRLDGRERPSRIRYKRFSPTAFINYTRESPCHSIIFYACSTHLNLPTYSGLDAFADISLIEGVLSSNGRYHYVVRLEKMLRYPWRISVALVRVYMSGCIDANFAAAKGMRWCGYKNRDVPNKLNPHNRWRGQSANMASNHRCI